MPRGPVGYKVEHQRHQRRRNLIDEISDSSDEEEGIPAFKKVKISADSLNVIEPTIKDDHMPWITKYRPRTIGEVALHSRKIEELRQSIARLLRQDEMSPRLLVVSGPSSSSKTSAVYCLLNSMGYSSRSIIEWVNHDPLDEGPTVTTAFSDFMDAAVYQRDKVIVIEDLPNLFHYETKEKFSESLNIWLNIQSRVGLPPVILIFSEFYFDSLDPRDSLLVEQKLPRKILQHPLVCHVKTSPVNKQLLTKVLKNIAAHESKWFRKVSRPNLDRVIKSIVTSGSSAASMSDADGCGNVRVAINLFEMWVKTTQVSPLSREIDSMAGLTTPQIDFFHAIARIINGRRKDKAGNLVGDDRSAVDSVLAQWEDLNVDGTMTHTLFENYINAHKGLLSVSSSYHCAEITSLADLLGTRLQSVGSDRHSAMSMDTSIVSDMSFRGIRSSLRQATLVKGGRSNFKQLTFHHQRKVDRERSKAFVELQTFVQSQRAHGNWTSLLDVLLRDGYYTTLKSRFQRRVGGTIAPQLNLAAEVTNINQFADDTSNAALDSTTIPAINASRPGYILSDDDIEDSD